VVVHHSAGGHADWIAEKIARRHVGVLGYPAIAYHLVVHWTGDVDLCLDLEEVSWHAGGLPRIRGVGVNNWKYLGLCLTGEFLDGREPELVQLMAARKAIARLRVVLGRDLVVLGHQDLASTLCPGSTWPKWSEFLR